MGTREGGYGSPSREGGYHRPRFGQCRVLAILAVLGTRRLAPARGSGWLRSLNCPKLRPVVTLSRGRWAEDASGGGSERRMKGLEKGADIGLSDRVGEESS